ncbi:MAG: flagellar basal body rod protein FlgC [Bacillota bacterium]
MSDFFSGFRISGSGMTAQRFRLDLLSNNIANIQTTRTPGGGPYQRKMPVFTEMLSGGVAVTALVPDPSSPVRVQEPGHPDADAKGFVAYPAVDLGQEMVNMIGATRAYQANVSAFEASKQMLLKALELGA